jgi:hypothetical protein
MFTKSGILKILIGLSAVVLIGFGAIYFFNNEDKPTGKRGPEAEQLTQKMFDAIGYEAWQEIDYIAWNFADRQQYVWDKKRHLVQVKWGDTEVLLDPSEVSGVAIVDGVTLSEEESYNTIKKAWDFFNNDSFWLNAPALARQPGTTRSVVTTEGGDKQLLITYTSGGSTPGDSYLWELDENGRPVSYKMWVKIIPVGGVGFTWEGWKDLGNGAMLATKHVGPGFTLHLTDIKTGENYTDFGFENDPFAAIARK